MPNFKRIGLGLATLAIATATANAQSFLCVDGDHVGGNGSGNNWTNAMTDLQEALDDARNLGIQHILVAEGTYYPTSGAWACGTPTAPSRTSTFLIELTTTELTLHGGFLGSNTNLDWNAPDGSFAKTILSGAQDDSYHVVVVANPEEYNTEVSLDGFMIRDGNADEDMGVSGISLSAAGAGILSLNANLFLENLRVKDNDAASAGGGVAFRTNSEDCGHSSGAERTLRCRFTRFRNNSAKDGGGIHTTVGSSLVLANVRFRNNTAAERGGGIFVAAEAKIDASNLLMHDNAALQGGAIRTRGGVEANFDNCTIAYNQVVIPPNPTIPPGGGGIDLDHNDQIYEIRNSILYFNYAPDLYVTDHAPGAPNPDTRHCDIGSVTGLTTSNGDISTDPKFANPGNRNLHLGGLSPCINAGSTPHLPGDYLDVDDDDNVVTVILPLDYDLNRRVVGVHVDMGCFESPVGAEQ